MFESIDIERKLAATTATILDNGARPDGVFVPEEGGMGPEQQKRLEHSLNAKYRRAGQGQIMVASEAGDLKALSFSPRDMSWLPITEQTNLKITRAYHVPYALLDINPPSQYGVYATLRLQTR